MQFPFGSGQLIAVNSTANSTPILFGAFQEGTVDFSGTTKKLFGQSQFPLAAARGETSITGKGKVAAFNARLYNDLFFGQTLAVGQLNVANKESGTVPATPFQITVANGANFVTDYGVIDALTGLPLVKVASTPATGEYSVAAGGVYTFASADTGKTVFITYSYTTAASGGKIGITNPLQGSQPFFKVNLNIIYDSKQAVLELNKCVSNKLTFNTKMADFAVQELDFEAFDDGTGNVGTISFAEQG